MSTSRTHSAQAHLGHLPSSSLPLGTRARPRPRPGSTWCFSGHRSQFAGEPDRRKLKVCESLTARAVSTQTAGTGSARHTTKHQSYASDAARLEHTHPDAHPAARHPKTCPP